MSEFFYYATYCRGGRPTEALLETTPEAVSAWKSFSKNEMEWAKDENLESKFTRMFRRGFDLPCHPLGEYAREKYYAAKAKTTGVPNPVGTSRMQTTMTLFATVIPGSGGQLQRCGCAVCAASWKK